MSEHKRSLGLDLAKHGEAAYPLVAYGHGWDDDRVTQEALRNLSMANGENKLKYLLLSKKMNIEKMTTDAQLFVTGETDVFRIEIFFGKRHQR